MELVGQMPKIPSISTDLPTRDAARLMGWTPQWMSKLIGEGAPHEVQKGHGRGGEVIIWNIPSLVRWLMEREAGKAQAQAAARAGTMAMDEAETRKKAADAEMAELKLAERRRELVTVSLYKERRASMIQGAKAQLLAIAPRLRARVGPEIAAMVDEEVNATLRAMGGESDGLPDSP